MNETKSEDTKRPTKYLKGMTTPSEGQFDHAALADPACMICEGKGMVHVLMGYHTNGKEYRIWSSCTCVQRNNRKITAANTVRRHFPQTMSEWTVANYKTGGNAFNEQAKKVAINFINNYKTASEKGWILGFWGEPGCGKSHLSTAIAQACVKKYGIVPAILNVPKMLRSERATFSDDGTSRPSSIDQAIQADLLVLDDLGAEYVRKGRAGDTGVSWVEEQLYLILDERIVNGRPTIYTTNFAPSDLAKILSPRIWGRIDRASVLPQALEMKKIASETRVNSGDMDLLMGGDAS